jgi:hypothetical protein
MRNTASCIEGLENKRILVQIFTQDSVKPAHNVEGSAIYIVKQRDRHQAGDGHGFTSLLRTA